MTVHYIQGADLPPLGVRWFDADGNLRDFSDGWTFEVRVGQPGATAEFVKTAGVTGSATSPNVEIDWSTVGELNTLATGRWTVQITAERAADSKQLRMQTGITVRAPVA